MKLSCERSLATTRQFASWSFVDDAELLDLYANALSVLFVPKDEDFGYITVEAMLSHKPVIVCKFR